MPDYVWQSARCRQKRARDCGATHRHRKPTAGLRSLARLVVEILFEPGYPQKCEGAFLNLSDAFPGDAVAGGDLFEGARLVAVESEPGSEDGLIPGRQPTKLKVDIGPA